MSTSITHADGSRVETIEHGDGTGTRTTYSPDGQVVDVEQLTDLTEPT